MLNAFLCMKRYLMGYLSLHSITSDFVPVLQSRKAKSWNDVKQGCIAFISFSLSFTVQKWVWQANSYHIHQVPNFDAQICRMWRNTGQALLKNIHSESQDFKCVKKKLHSCWNILLKRLYVYQGPSRKGIFLISNFVMGRAGLFVVKYNCSFTKVGI